MIGGMVIQSDATEGATRLWVMDRNGDELCVHARDKGEGLPGLGEECWWQSGEIMFGGPDRKHGEKRAEKVGYSHSPQSCRKREEG